MTVPLVSANLTRLLTMVFLPLGLFATAILYWSASLEQTQAENRLIDTARALALAVDRQLATSIAALNTLAESAVQHDSDPSGFYDSAKRVGERYGGWIVLADASAQQLMNTRVPQGAPLPRSANPEVIAQVFATRRPVVSDLFIGTVAQQPIISIHVPVGRDGRVDYALDMVITSEVLTDLLGRHPIPEGWDAGIIDSMGKIVASTRGRSRVGQPASEWLLAAINERSEGVVEGNRSNGLVQRVGFARVSDTPLTVALGAPAATMSIWKTGPLAVFIAGGTAMFILLVFLAVRHADRLIRSLSSMVLVGNTFGAGSDREVARSSTRQALEGYGVAVASVAMAIVVRLLLDPLLGDRYAFITLFPAVAVAVWYGGWGPGIFAMLAGYACTHYFVMEPRLTFGLKSKIVAAGFAVFIASSLVILALGARARRAELGEGRRAALAESSDALLRTLLAHAPIGITVAGGPPSFPIIVNSRSAVELAGRRPEELVGMPVGAHEKAFGFHLPDGVHQLPPEATPLYRACHGESVQEQEGLVVRPDGSRIVVNMTAVPIRDASGNIVGGIKCWYDVTRRKAAETALREADVRKDAFLATLAHELRNPLAAIRNTLVLVSKPGVPESTSRRAGEIAMRQVNQLTRLVDDLLDVSRITMGKIQLDLAPIRLETVIEEAIESCRSHFEKLRHAFHVVVADQPMWVHGDHTRLVQVLTNILVNSAKYTPPGGHITLTCTVNEALVTLCVRDDGIGIAAEFLPHVFEPFQQGEVVAGEIRGGLGIGLTLVKQLVEWQGGTVEANSPGPGKGSTFIVRLPRIDAPVTTGTQADKLPPTAAAEAGPEARRVLVVDDNIDAAESTSILLRLHGHVVRSVPDGQQALDVIREFRPDVMVVDLGMPGLSGYDVARSVRATPESKNVLLIALTGWGHESHRGRTADAGFDHHLVKPVDPRILNELVCSASRSEFAAASPIPAERN